RRYGLDRRQEFDLRGIRGIRAERSVACLSVSVITPGEDPAVSGECHGVIARRGKGDRIGDHVDGHRHAVGVAVGGAAPELAVSVVAPAEHETAEYGQAEIVAGGDS